MVELDNTCRIVDLYDGEYTIIDGRDNNLLENIQLSMVEIITCRMIDLYDGEYTI